MLYTGYRYPEGHIFFEEGLAGTVVHIVKSGRVEITKQRGNQEQVIT